MGSDVSRALYRGLIIPDPTVTSANYWTAESNADFASPRPGTPVAQTETDAVVLSHGESQTASSTLRVRTHKGGFPAPGSDGASFVWRSADSGEYRGSDTYGPINAWENASYSTTADSFGSLHAVTHPDGEVIVIYEHITAVGANRAISVRVRSASGTWGSAVAIDAETDATYLRAPCLVMLPNGRILAFAATYQGSGGTTWQVDMYFSDDKGSTWTRGGKHTLAATESNPLKRLRAAYKDGQILMVAHHTDAGAAADDLLEQYASDSMGTRFTSVGVFSGANTDNSGGYPEVLAMGGMFCILFISQNGVDIRQRRVANAFEYGGPGTTADVVVSATAATVAAGAFTDGDLAAFVDEDGVGYLFYRNTGGTVACYAAKTTDSGDSWASTCSGVVSGVWWRTTAGTGIIPSGFTATAQRGRAVVMHQWLTGSTSRRSLSAAYLGGYTSRTRPWAAFNRTPSLQASWSYTYLPFDTPNNLGYTTVAAGAGAQSVASPGELKIDCTGAAADTLENWIAPGGSLVQGLTGEFVARRVSGRFSCIVRIDDGATVQARIEIRMDGNLTLFDDIAGTTLAGPVAVSGNTAIKFAFSRPAAGDAEVTVDYRAHDTSEDQLWISLANGINVPTAATSGAVHRIRWGKLSAASTGESYVREFHFAESNNNDFTYSAGFTNPDDLLGRNYSLLPQYVDDGVRISMVDGPSYTGDWWKIDTRYDYGVENCIPSETPSPRQYLRTLTAPNGQALAFARGSYDSKVGNDVIGLYLGGINCRNARLSGYSGGAWSSIAAPDFFVTLDCTRTGNTIVPGAAAAATGAYLHRDELVGGRVVFTATGQQRIITANTEGNWTVTTAKFPTITMAGIDDTEPANGTIEIWFPNALIIMDLTGTNAYRGYKLALSRAGATPVEGYHQLGTLAVGPVAVFGYDSSRGRVVTRSPNTSLTTLPDGSRRSRVLGPSRRTVEMSWAEGVDVTSMRSAGAPDYVRTSNSGGALATAARWDTPLMLQDLLESLDGPQSPVVYCPYIERGTPNTRTYLYGRQKGSMLARITSPVVLETDVGTEESSEVYRVASITFDEEV